MRELDNEIMSKRSAFYEKHGVFPTRLFLDRETYLDAIMTAPYHEELGRARTFNGLVLYQTIRFGTKGERLVEVAA